MVSLDDMPDVIRAEQVAAVLGVGKKFVYEQAKEGNIPGAFRVGRVLRFSKTALAAGLGLLPTHRPSGQPA